MFRKLILMLLFANALTSCDRWHNNQQQINQNFDERLNELELELFPEIKPCNTQKKCFEEQLSTLIQKQLPQQIVWSTIENDTIWIKIQVNRNGIISANLPTRMLASEAIKSTIDSTLNAINPIKPGYIQGVPVTCNFKLPLILNKKTN